LPDKGSLAAVPWSVCSEPVLTASGGLNPEVRVRVGAAPSGSQSAPGGGGLLVQGADGTDYLVWQGKRLRLAGREARAALGYGTTQPLTVGDAWLNALPAGADLAAADVPDRGAAGPSIGAVRTRVGQVVQATGVGSAAQYYLMRADGVQAITQVDAALLLGSPASQAAYPGAPVAAVPVSVADMAAMPYSAAARVTRTDQPASPPPLAQPPAESTALCATYTDTSGASTAMTVSLRTEQPGAASGSAPAADPLTGGPVANHVDVTPGGGALVRELPSPGVTGGVTYLITDLGYKFPVADADALNSLGYRGVTAAPIPAALLQLVPTGPALDPRAAADVVPVR
jgi:type VII secretion protein EccB